MTQKYGPHFLDFKNNLVPLRDSVHFDDETYLEFVGEIEEVASLASAVSMDRVNQNLLPTENPFECCVHTILPLFEALLFESIRGLIKQ